LPARSQVIRKIQLNSKEDSVLIPNQEIKHGINIASTTATSKNAFIRLLNTTNKDQEVSTNILAYESLSNYEAVKGGEGVVGAIAEQSIPQHSRTLPNIPGQQQPLRLPLSISACTTTQIFIQNMY